MSTAKPPAQAALDDYDEGQILPAPFKLPALSCEVCGTSSAIVFSSDVATMCEHCARTISKLRARSIPTVLGALRAARRIHLTSIGRRPDRK
nr:hypothetical protein [Candidatus Sigynarchaeum springense]